MYSIIPLAGPDFWIDKLKTLKPLIDIEGMPLVERAVKSRPWYQSGALKDENILFVLRDTEHTAAFQTRLQEMFPGCKTSTISHLTSGALMTCLAGLSLIPSPHEPVCVDLVDILYDGEDMDIPALFRADPDLGGVLPYFKDTYEKYSYLDIRGGYVAQTVEKRVISDNASAGTYWFRNASVLLEAVAGSLKLNKVYEVNGALFLCPAYNEVVRAGWRVLGVPVKLKKCLSRTVKDLG